MSFRMSTIDSAEYQIMIDRLREAREESGLTQDEVADEFGLLQSFVSKVENGDRRIDPVELCRFAELYEKPVAWFLNEKCA
jgi:transcriptional regulator with XRE-family HTH domain